MNYTIATTKNVHGGYEIELCQSGNKRYIVLTNDANGKVYISEKMDADKATEAYWEVAKLMVELMHGWSDWVEIIEEAA